MAGRRRLLADRYEVGEVIGYGGMAEVHRGRDLRLGRDVAIKLLRTDLSRDPAFQGRFRREAQSAASLNSPSIVAVYDTGEGEVDGVPTPYIVMEFVEGQTLRDLLAAEGHLLPQRAMEITAAVCVALEQAHAAGIVHRDIKPGNVMLTATGEVKVMDFGIARALTTSTTMTQTAAVIGTAHYLSPEQARGEHVDARSDIYSTGCLLYELLTGAPPFTGDTPVAVAYQHVREDPMPPSTVEPGVPAACDAIVLVAMAKNPVNRYQSAAELRADLERALAGKPVHASPVLAQHEPLAPVVSPTTVLMREPVAPRRRGAAYAALGAAAIAVFVIALWVASNVLGSSTKDLTTPDLKHLSLADAKTTLASEGLAVGKVDFKYTGKNNNGEVIGQFPPAGVFLHKGQSVDLTVSNGVQIVVVPTGLIGQTIDDAKQALLAANLKTGPTLSRNSRAPADQVLDSQPAAGTQVPAGTKVSLVVSNAHVKVPDVTGDDVTTASQILQQHQFVPVQRPGAVFKPKLPEGTVLSQSPAGGTFAASGSSVVIYVNEKPTKPKPSPSTSNSSPAVSPSPTTSSSRGG